MTTPTPTVADLALDDFIWPVPAHPVPVSKMGHDHWSTLAYVETRIVDHGGFLNAEQMRTDPDRHPACLGRAQLGFPSPRKYPTRLRSALPLGQVTGDLVPVELPDHDDWDCLSDLVAAGLLTATLPAPAGPPTGLALANAMPRARWALTERGFAVAAQLRNHQAQGNKWATFTLAS